MATSVQCAYMRSDVERHSSLGVTGRRSLVGGGWVVGSKLGFGR